MLNILSIMCIKYLNLKKEGKFMKKKLVISVMLVMLLCMVGCGAETTNAEVETVTETVAETVEETIVEESEVVEVEETTEEVVVEISREDMAMEKINKLKAAYYDLINSKDPIAMSMQYFIEYAVFPIGSNDLRILSAVTTDGKGIDFWAVFPVLCDYYYDYVNNDVPKTDFAEKINPYSSSEILLSYYGVSDAEYIDKEILKNEGDGNGMSLNYASMCSASWFMPYMVSFDEITLGECLETTEYKICGVESAYIYPIYFDGKDIGSFAIFDAKDNLLNIYYPDELTPNAYTWMGEDVTIYTMIPELEEMLAEEETTEVVEE